MGFRSSWIHSKVLGFWVLSSGVFRLCLGLWVSWVSGLRVHNGSWGCGFRSSNASRHGSSGLGWWVPGAFEISGLRRKAYMGVSENRGP